MPYITLPTDINPTILSVLNAPADAPLTKVIWHFYGVYKAFNPTTEQKFNVLYAQIKTNYKSVGLPNEFSAQDLSEIWGVFQVLKSWNIASHDELFAEITDPTVDFNTLNYTLPQILHIPLNRKYSVMLYIVTLGNFDVLNTLVLEDRIISRPLLHYLVENKDCWDNHTKCIDFLISRGANPNLEITIAPQKPKLTALQLSIMFGNVGMARVIAETCPSTLQYIDSNHNTILASWFLLSKDLPSRRTQRQYNTLRTNRINIFKLLLEQGANSAVKVNNDTWVATYAVSEAKELLAPIITKLLDAKLEIETIKKMLPSNFCLVRHLLNCGESALAYRILKLGCTENPLSTVKMPALASAATIGAIDCIKLLLLQSQTKYYRSVFFAITAPVTWQDNEVVESFKYRSVNDYSRDIFYAIITAMFSQRQEVLAFFKPDFIQSNIGKNVSKQQNLIDNFIKNNDSNWANTSARVGFLSVVPLLLQSYLENQDIKVLLESKLPADFCIIRWALECNATNLVTYLLKCDVKPKQTESAEMIVLVIKHKLPELIKLFFAVDNSRLTLMIAMIWAIQNIRRDILEILFEINPDVTEFVLEQDTQQFKYLKDFIGTPTDRVDIYFNILRSLANFMLRKSLLTEVTKKIPEDFSLITWLVHFKFPMVAEYFLEREFVPNLEAEDLDTALILAAGLGYNELVIQLLNRRNSIMANDPIISEALMSATQNGRLSILQTFARYNIKVSEHPDLLIEALSSEQYEVMRYLLTQGLSPDVLHMQTYPLISHAIWNGHPKAVDLLLEFGANVMLREAKTGYAPLHCAFSKALLPLALFNSRIKIDRTSDLGLIQKLLEKGADPLCVCNGGNTPYGMFHINQNFYTTIDFKKGATLLEDAIKAKLSLLSISVAEQPHDPIQFSQLLNNRNKTEWHDAEGVEIVIYAILSGNFKAINDLNSQYKIAAIFTAKMEALENDRTIHYLRARWNLGYLQCINVVNALLQLILGNWNVSQFYANMPSDFCIIRTLIRQGKVNLVSLLLAEGVRETKGLNDSLAITLAAKQGFSGLVVQLLPLIKLDFTNSIHRDFIIGVIKRKDLDILKAVHQFDRDIIWKFDYFNEISSLYLAIQEGTLEILQYLLSLHSDPEVVANWNDPNHATLLIFTVQEDRLQIIEWLLRDSKFKLEINAADVNGMTALHWAADDNDIEVIELLLEYGADPNRIDKDDKTPLDIIRNRGEEFQTAKDLLTPVTKKKIDKQYEDAEVSIDTNDNTLKCMQFKH